MTLTKEELHDLEDLCRLEASATADPEWQLVMIDLGAKLRDMQEPHENPLDEIHAIVFDMLHEEPDARLDHDALMRIHELSKP